MPITQTRMLAVIASGEAWRSAFDALALDIKRLVANRTRDLITEDDLIASLRNLANENSPPIASVENLIAEKRYFAIHAHRNTMARQRASQYRWEDGIPRVPTAPDKPAVNAATRRKLRQEQKKSLGRGIPQERREEIMREANMTDAELRIHKNPDLAKVNEAPEPFDLGKL